MRNEEKRNETVNCLEQCIQSMQKTSALCKLSKQLQVLLDGLDRCDAKLDAKLDVKNTGVYPYRDKKKPEHYDDYIFYLREAGLLPKPNNKKDLVCFDEAYSDTAFEMRMSLKERIQDEIHWMNSETIAIDALESLNIDWKSIWKAIWEAAIKYACETRFAQTDEQIEYESHNMQQQLTRLANTNNGIMKFAQFISNMRITPSKEEQAVLINRADEIQIGGKTLLEWFEIYQTEAEKYNAPLRRARSIRSQDSNRSYVTEQIQRINQPQKPLSLFPFKSKIKQYEKINNVKIIQQTQIKDNKVKPLNKLSRPYFSPKLGSWEIDLVFGVNPVTRRRQHYLFAININTKYLVVIPLIVDEKNATFILAALKKLINQVYVNNIRGDGETGFKANIIRQFCEDNKISLYFTGSPFTQHNRVVDSVIRTIRNGFGQDLLGETKQIRKKQSKKPVPQLVEKQPSPIDEVLHAPLIDQTVNPIPLVQSEQEKVEQRGRPKKYSSQEEAERIAAEQRSRAQQKYRIQRQELRATANDLQLLLIRRLQKTIITNVQDLLQISEIIDRYNQ
ncbi:MAG: hypothetical protein EZS28_032845 [Streblomastix strix]|uniref:Integrase catalytic domain-containing protein n=1 Tax=Streblomastix strix TaxID=222440 RepID=A0A5J4UMI6_9EUKA|nr:MAG: hypothetical protein EZS28_032845 [Streblomastix strix]